jgi:hypothetical protein
MSEKKLKEGKEHNEYSSNNEYNQYSAYDGYSGYEGYSYNYDTPSTGASDQYYSNAYSNAYSNDYSNAYSNDYSNAYSNDYSNAYSNDYSKDYSKDYSSADYTAYYSNYANNNSANNANTQYYSSGYDPAYQQAEISKGYSADISQDEQSSSTPATAYYSAPVLNIQPIDQISKSILNTVVQDQLKTKMMSEKKRRIEEVAQPSKKVQKKSLRAAGGEVWSDQTLLDWDDSKKRIIT